MLNTSTQTLISEVIEEKVDNDEMFTAFDISLEVQTRAKSRGEAVERHRDMKEAIHQEMDRFIQHGVYDKQLHEVGAPQKAFLYFPVGENPDDYAPKARKDAPQVSPSGGSTPTPVAPNNFASGGNTPTPMISGGSAATAIMSATRNAVPKSTTDCNDLGRHVDARGTLTIPAVAIMAAGFHPGDKATFYSDRNNGNNVGVLSHTLPPGKAAIAEYTVDKDHNVRVTDRALSDALLTGANPAYDFESGNDHIVIRIH